MLSNFLLKDIIQDKLKEHKMNASDLERKAMLAPSSIRKILLGTSKNPTLETLNAICDVFNCSIDELVGRNLRKATRMQEQTTNIFLVLNRASNIYSINQTLEGAEEEAKQLEEQGRRPDIVEIVLNSNGLLQFETILRTPSFNKRIFEERINKNGEMYLVRKKPYMMLDEFANLVQGWNSDSTDEWRVKIGVVGQDGQAVTEDFLGVIHPDYINKVFTLYALPEEE